MRRLELQHHTPEQVAGYINQAAMIVVEAELYDDLQPLAFVEAIRLLAAKNIQIEQVQPLHAGLMQVPRG